MTAEPQGALRGKEASVLRWVPRDTRAPFIRAGTDGPVAGPRLRATAGWLG